MPHYWRGESTGLPGTSDNGVLITWLSSLMAFTACLNVSNCLIKASRWTRWVVDFQGVKSDKQRGKSRRSEAAQPAQNEVKNKRNSSEGRKGLELKSFLLIWSYSHSYQQTYKLDGWEIWGNSDVSGWEPTREKASEKRLDTPLVERIFEGKMEGISKRQILTLAEWPVYICGREKERKTSMRNIERRSRDSLGPHMSLWTSCPIGRPAYICASKTKLSLASALENSIFSRSNLMKNITRVPLIWAPEFPIFSQISPMRIN